MLAYGHNIRKIKRMSNGYEIRLELLKMAKEVLSQRFDADCQKAKLEWEASGKYDVLSFPTQYTMSDIIAEAVYLNRFINNKT
jgi:hypothetical protein